MREYQIDLVQEFDTLSWRRFQVLVRCLSSTSATVSKLNSGRYIGEKDKENLVVGPKAAEAAFIAAFKPPAPSAEREKVDPS